MFFGGVFVAGAAALIYVNSGLFVKMPPKDSFEAQTYCGQLFNERYIRSDYAQEWLAKPIMDKFKMEVSFLPEVAQKEVMEKAKPYLEDLTNDNEISEATINNLGYLIENAKAKK